MSEPVIPEALPGDLIEAVATRDAERSIGWCHASEDEKVARIIARERSVRRTLTDALGITYCGKAMDIPYTTQRDCWYVPCLEVPIEEQEL